MSRTIRTDPEGNRWCLHRKPKVVYDTPEEAWIGAFLTFITCGWLVSPYRCGRSVSGFGEVRWRVGRNPWAFMPWLFSIGMHTRHTKGCGKWHLTKSTAHELPRATDALRLQHSDFLVNPAGLLVGPARQCHTAKGKPKQIFTTEDNCITWINQHLKGRGFPYRCDFGHIHISNKAWTRPIIQRAPGECGSTQLAEKISHPRVEIAVSRST